MPFHGHFISCFHEFHFRWKSKTIYKASNVIRNIKCPMFFEFQVSSKSFWTGTLKFQTTKFNPLSPNSVRHQFSPNNIHTLSRGKVMRINKMITIEKIPWYFIKFSQLILKVDVWRSVWRICMWILGLKGSKDKWIRKFKIYFSLTLFHH